MSQEIVLGTITDFYDDGTVMIKATVPNLEKALLRKYKSVQIGFNDGRHISPEQRKKCFALISEIAEYIEGYRTSETIENTKQMLKMDFVLHRLHDMERKMFSLSDVSMSTASDFITYIIDFIIRNDIPTKISLLEHCEDIGKYIYACTLNRKCCVCGKPAENHHITGSKIGIGSNRQEVHHLGREVLPLCRVHHDECHNDEVDFMNKHHLQAVKLDETLCRKLKLKK